MLAVVTTVAAEATTAVAHAPPTQVSQGKAQGMGMAAAMAVANRAASVAHKPHALRETSSHANREMKYSAKTHAAPALTWVSSATTLTNANRPAMCQQASHHLACLRAALVVAVAEAAIVAVAAAETSVAVAHAQAAVGVTPAAGFDAELYINLR